MRVWVNVFVGKYAHCVDGNPFYISQAYKTKSQAKQSIQWSKMDKYIDTVKIEFKAK